MPTGQLGNQAHLQMRPDLRVGARVIAQPVVGVLPLIAGGPHQRLWPLQRLGRLHVHTVTSCVVTFIAERRRACHEDPVHA